MTAGAEVKFSHPGAMLVWLLALRVAGQLSHQHTRDGRPHGLTAG